MDITIVPSPETRTDGFRESVADRLRQRFSRFSHRIAHIDVALTDENGPRGGADKQCRVRVLMHGLGEIATTARDDSVWAAIDQAVMRARRKVVTKIKRPRSLRERFRRHRLNDTGTPDL